VGSTSLPATEASDTAAQDRRSRRSSETCGWAPLATLAELMARLGHSTSVAALRYQHAAQGRDAAIADALSGLAATQLAPVIPLRS